MEDVIGCLLVTCWSAVSRCAVPRASTEWSLSANSFNSGSTRTILHSLTIKGGPFLLIFEDCSSPWVTKRALPGNATARCRFRLVLRVLSSIFGCVSLTRGSFLPFSVGMPQLARIVQSLWRLLAALQPSQLTDKGNFFRGYAWHSLKRSCVSTKPFAGSMSKWALFDIGFVSRHAKLRCRNF